MLDSESSKTHGVVEFSMAKKGAQSKLFGKTKNSHFMDFELIYDQPAHPLHSTGRYS